MIGIIDIESAYQRISHLIHHTPVLTSNSLNSITGADLFFKCENFQKAGAFKFRGACNAVFSLNDQEAVRGVCTHSSGNFAQALALAAQIRGVRAFIVMPSNASRVKVEAVKHYGGEIHFCEPTLQAREQAAKQIMNRTQACFIHPYDNYNIIAGQGTASIEALKQIELPDIIMVPVGGGGLLCGTAIAAKQSRKAIRVIAAEPKGADDAFRSFRQKQWLPSVNPKTMADGLLTSLGERNFP
ncbi:MAG TPA: pyridoxal-phosphate dependent enzyme, partial [Bacteroidales bacterium]|nr:pyridoxal-phosphate dependent enzyme [Bacteroidales bacterium]